MTSRFKALNLESPDKSEGDNDAPTKEALEEKATARYMLALSHQGNEQWEDAMNIYQELLESEVLSKVCNRVTFINGRIKPSLEHLKYCCYMNLGHVLVAKNQFEDGLEIYKEALKFDNTDLNLWYKIGLLGMKLVDLNVAISALEEALKISPRHFPSLDHIITATYAQGGLLTSLHYIARALEYNPKYKKGLALKDKIFKNHPSMKEHYALFNPYPDYLLDPEELSDINEEVAEKFYQEVLNLRSAEQSRHVSCEPQLPPQYTLPCRPTTWLQLSLLLSATHTQFTEEAPHLDFFRPVNLQSDRQFSDVDMEVGVEADLSADEEVDNINADVANEGEDVEPSGTVCAGVRSKRRRSSPTPLEQLKSGKRRSTRVRNTWRKEEPTLARALTSLLPPSLLLHTGDGKKDNEVVRWNEDSLDTMDMFRLFEKEDMSADVRELELTNCLSEEKRAKIVKEEGYFGSEKENTEVSKFVEENSGLDVLTLVEKLLLDLSGKWQLYWPHPLPQLFLQFYKIYLQHRAPKMFGPPLLTSEPEGAACVLFGELLLEQWLTSKCRSKTSPLSGSCLGGEFPSLLLGDLHDLISRSSCPVFTARTLWMHALLCLYNEDVNTAIHKLCILENNEKLAQVNVHLVNVTNHFIINKGTVQSMLSTLNRKQMVEELSELYQQDDCEQIAAILSEVLQPSKLSVSLFQPALDRDTQYSLLLYSLWRLDRINECVQWAETFVHESVTQLLAAVAEDNSELRSKWLTVLYNTILCILTCVDHKGPQVFDSLENNKLPRLVQSLSHVICRQIEMDKVTDLEFDIISPWMLLYEIISHHDQGVEVSQALPALERLPRSIRLLFTAHEYLGRRTWCCQDEAVILFQTLHQLQTLMDLYHLESEEYNLLSKQLEQIFYCLYGHPVKRNKPKYIIEHKVDGLKLTWLRSHQVLALLRPKELPTYDSSSKCSISVNNEALFRRIIELVPPEINPNRLTVQMNEYIDGTVDEIPRNDRPLPLEMADIYYLIADHHFKNKTWSKAIKYYVLDVCNNPERVDSWACLALARGSMLETKLNSCDALKSQSEFLKKAMMSCRCYKTSLDLDSGLPTLWIEYGSFSYMVHSFSSRLLKQEQNLSLEMFNFLETQKESMIQTALSCFTSANKLWYTEDGQEMQDERWLHHYMLGKIAEKKQEPATQFLSHYIKSMEFLHLNNAMYPALVTYNSPQNLAVEALELYYRVHAVILKTLEQSEDKPLDPVLRKQFKETLSKVAAGPFAQRVTRSEESENGINVKKTIYIDSEETRMAAVRRLMDSVLELVEADVDFEEPTKAVAEKREAEPNDQPAKRVKREDSETSEKSKESKKSIKSVKRNSTESSSDSESDSDSSSSDSTSSDSSQDSSDSSEEEKSDGEKKEAKDSEADTGDWKKEQDELTSACLDALEDCARRFPEHYKSLYRLSHFYFRSKLRRNVVKARELLLGERGLFADRKPSNFFNGVWRIPSNEIDRPGSFASHMSRCVLLLVDVLRHTRDHKMLFDLALRLRDTPESDKKYLRDPEREELSKEALSLSVQALRKTVSEAKTPEDQKSALLETYKIYRRCSKLWEQKQALFIATLTEAYTQLKKEEGSNVLEAAEKFCSQEVAVQKAVAPPTAFSSPDVSQASSPVPLLPPVPAQQKPPPMPTAPVKRGRGRPSTSSLRQQNPNTFSSTEELAQLYMMNQKIMNQTKTGQSGANHNQNLNQTQQMMLGNAAMALSQQITYQTLRQQYLLTQQAKAAQMQAMKDRFKMNLLQQKPDPSKSSASVNSLLAPSKVSVFSSQSILLANQQAMKKQVAKTPSSLSISIQPSNSNSSGGYQLGMQPPPRTSLQVVKQTATAIKPPSPFQQRLASESKVSLQHKLLTAKMGKPQVSGTTITGTKSLISTAASFDKSKQQRDKPVVQTSSSLPTTTLGSRGVTITPAKPPEIKIPKEITFSSGLSISPLGSSLSPLSKTKSALSPSSSKEVTVTLLKGDSNSSSKTVKSNSSISVTIMEGKKSQLSPGGDRQSPTPKLRMGGAVTITPAKPSKPVPQTKPIPKADFSISLSSSADAKKKDGNDVIVID